MSASYGGSSSAFGGGVNGGAGPQGVKNKIDDMLQRQRARLRAQARRVGPLAAPEDVHDDDQHEGEPDHQVQLAERLVEEVSDPRPTIKQLLTIAPIVAGLLHSFVPNSPIEVGALPNATEATRHLFPNVTVVTAASCAGFSAAGTGDSPTPSSFFASPGDAAKRFKRTENATAMIWRVLLIAEKRFRKLDAPHLAAEVYRGVAFDNGVKITKSNQRVAA